MQTLIVILMSPMGLEGRHCPPVSPKEDVFQNFPRHVCVAISYVVIRAKTGGLLSPSEAPDLESALMRPWIQIALR